MSEARHGVQFPEILTDWKSPQTFRSLWKIWSHEEGGDRTTRESLQARLANLNLEMSFCFGFVFEVMTKMVRKYGSSERCCQFYFKLRIWCFCRLLFSIKLKCFGNNKTPMKYISRCFYGKFPRQLLSEEKTQAAEQASYFQTTQEPSEPKPCAVCPCVRCPCVRCTWPSQRTSWGRAKGAFPSLDISAAEGFSFYTESASKLCSRRNRDE